MRQSWAFSFVRVKDRQGDFNVDVKDVQVKVVLGLPSPRLRSEEEDSSNGNRTSASARFRLSGLEVHVAWDDIVVKFERIAGRFSTIADFFLNQVRTA